MKRIICFFTHHIWKSIPERRTVDDVGPSRETIHITQHQCQRCHKIEDDGNDDSWKWMFNFPRS